MHMLRNKIGHSLLLLLLFFLIVGLVGCSGEKKDETDNGVTAEQATPGNAEIPPEQLIAKGMEVDGFSYEYVLTMPTGEKFVHKMWAKEGNMRSEMENPYSGEPTLSIVNVTEKAVYVYQPAHKQAIAMPLDDSSVDTTSPKDYLGELDSSDMIYMKTETFDGKECRVYETADGKIWIWEEHGMPLRIELQSEEGDIIVEFLNFKIGDIDDSLFKLPEGTQIMDLGSLMKQ